MDDFENTNFNTRCIIITTLSSGSCCSVDFVVDEAAVAQLISFGFSRNHVIKALQETSNSVERAADWLFNHPDDGETEMMDSSPAPASEPAQGESSSASEQDYRKFFLYFYVLM